MRVVRGVFGGGLRHEERTLHGRRIVLMQTEEAAAEWDARAAEAAAGGAPPPERPAVLFVPGGAFIADFEAADLFFLHRWVRQTDALVVYLTYDFAPQVPYPGPMLNVALAYRALREHKHDLGFRASPLAVVGLSAGGNLAMAALLAPLLLHHAPPPVVEALGGCDPVMPDAILLLCPVLNICRSPSPSRVVFASDVLLPQPLLKAFATAYDNDSDHWMVRDPIFSPVFAPDEALRQLPPTTILCGGLDPLLDDSVDFNTRIRRMGVPGELHIYRSLPHTFVSFPHWHILPEVESALAKSVQFLRAVCSAAPAAGVGGSATPPGGSDDPWKKPRSVGSQSFDSDDGFGF